MLYSEEKKENSPGLKSLFKRKRLLLMPRDQAAQNSLASPIETECTALVINSSQIMAKEITMQLTLQMPNCSIMYAPTIALARWILRRRKIDLIVSSPVLPDGGVTTLSTMLQGMASPPDVLIVGALSARTSKLFDSSGYKCNVLRTIKGFRESSPPRADPVKDSIKALGADIRNDLNNPLQEIVAMVFVAQATGQASETTLQALEAIDRAAKGMAKVVNSLENKIMGVVR